MLHFDSHPDLQIDTNMAADTAFNKQELLETLSIENWIMPAIYAGHLGHVTWLKPPWADQLPEGSRKVKVGKHTTSGKMRINWADSYFLSDLLYAPEWDMQNVREAVINVVTMDTSCKQTIHKPLSTNHSSDATCHDHRHFTAVKGKPAESLDAASEQSLDDSKGATSNVHPSGDCKTKERTCAGDPIGRTEQRGNVDLKDCNRASSLCSDVDNMTSGLEASPHGKFTDSHRLEQETSASKRTLEDVSPSAEQRLDEASPSSRRTKEEEKGPQSAAHPEAVGDSDCDANGTENNARPDTSNERDDASLSANLRLDDASPSAKRAKTDDAERILEDGHLGTKTSLDNVVKDFSDFRGRFILDIDLDFFSTRNPFKEMYTKEQYRMLTDLYQFAAPQNESPYALTSCQEERGKQISELSAGLAAAFAGKEYDQSYGDTKRFEKLQGLVESIRSTPDVEAECLDPEMVHMAGLTCDDHGELPHHVSSDQEVDALVVAMATLLRNLPKPTMVTVSRSSHDDYCPVEQVDGIQRKVISMLQSTYRDIAIHLEYESV